MAAADYWAMVLWIVDLCGVSVILLLKAILQLHFNDLIDKLK